MLALAVAPALPPWPASQTAADEASVDKSSTQQQQQQLPAGTVPWDRPLPQLLGADNVSSWCAHGWMLFENMVVVQDRYPLLSMPDRQLPQPPAAAAAAAAVEADRNQAGEGTSRSSSSSSGSSVVNEAIQQQDVEDSKDAGLWSTGLRVGFIRPELAAHLRAAAHARHLWGPPLQQKQQQQGSEGASSSSSSSSSSAAAASLPRVVTVLLYPEDYPPVANHYALVDMLRDVAEPYGFKVGFKHALYGYRVLGSATVGRVRCATAASCKVVSRCCQCCLMSIRMYVRKQSYFVQSQATHFLQVRTVTQCVTDHGSTFAVHLLSSSLPFLSPFALQVRTVSVTMTALISLHLATNQPMFDPNCK
jgi:hypothetical protein